MKIAAPFKLPKRMNNIMTTGKSARIGTLVTVGALHQCLARVLLDQRLSKVPIGVWLVVARRFPRRLYCEQDRADACPIDHHSLLNLVVMGENRIGMVGT